jgi:hypothetical protein
MSVFSFYMFSIPHRPGKRQYLIFGPIFQILHMLHAAEVILGDVPQFMRVGTSVCFKRMPVIQVDIIIPINVLNHKSRDAMG